MAASTCLINPANCGKMCDNYSVECVGSIGQFWRAMGIWSGRPQLINKRLSGASAPVAQAAATDPDALVQAMLGTTLVQDAQEALDGQPQWDGHPDTSHALMRRLLPKGQLLLDAADLFQVEIWDVCKAQVTFLPFADRDVSGTLPNVSYSVQYTPGLVSMRFLTGASDWLRRTLLPRIARWANTVDESGTDSSQKLVDTEKYVRTYARLKAKHFARIRDMWTETTDPDKFIHEDIAIAAYILVLWEQECGDSPQTFVDIGCGNGLLVYLLSSEGHVGRGFDVRARKIWDAFPGVDLKVFTWCPAKGFGSLSGFDWLIGNHPDELTPWIPLAAASEGSKFLIIPCCPWGLSGRFSRRKSGQMSCYTDFLDYLEELSRQIGFVRTERDRMRIPSTKRTCIVGLELIPDHQAVNQILSTVSGFQVRSDQVPRPRNLANLNPYIVSGIIQITTQLLLELGPETGWNCGGQVPLSQVALKIPSDWLQEMRSECGGVQTVLRNQHHVFVVEGGLVRFRVPGDVNESKRKKRKVRKGVARYKKPCWFHTSHPQGCPISSDECNYSHETNS